VGLTGFLQPRAAGGERLVPGRVFTPHCYDQAMELGNAAAPGDDLRKLSDSALTAEGDKAWQSGDADRASQIKTERARRKAEHAKQRAADELMRGVFGMYGFAILMTVLIILNTLQKGNVIRLVPLLVPAAIGGLAYYTCKGNRGTALVASAIILAIAIGDLVMSRRPNALLAGFEIVSACYSCLAVKGAFTLRRLAG